MMTPSEIKQIKDTYVKGIEVELISMQGESRMVNGLKGTVDCVDDIGQIHVNWENGSSLALIPGVDEFRIVEPSMTMTGR